MSARKRISLEVKDTAIPIVTNLVKQKILSLSKELVPAAVKESLYDLTHIQQELKDNLVFSSLSGISSDAIPLDCAKSIPLDVVDDFKGIVQKGNIIQKKKLSRK